MEITVKNSSGEEVATGELEVDTSGPSPTATFTPTDGTEADCRHVVWNAGANGTVSFKFDVSGEDNGEFPCGQNGSQYTYHFAGNQNSQGSSPSGTVNFPSAGIADDDNDTWQAGASGDETFEDEDEPHAQSQSAG